MPPTKTQVEPQTKAAPATATAKQPPLPEKQAGPGAWSWHGPARWRPTVVESARWLSASRPAPPAC